jgi:hypothetical protein
MDTSTQATELIPVKGSTVAKPKRQHRTIEEKWQIVEETLVEGASVARIARAHGINANQVFGWRLHGGIPAKPCRSASLDRSIPRKIPRPRQP